MPRISSTPNTSRLGVTRRRLVTMAGAAGVGMAVGSRALAAQPGQVSRAGALLADLAGEEPVGASAVARAVPASMRTTLMAGMEMSDEPVMAAAPDAQPAQDLSNVTNIADFYLSDDMRRLIAANGFAVSLSGAGPEFFEVYESNRYNLLPNFVTVDSMMHTYHLYFSFLQKRVEKNYLLGMLTQMTGLLYQDCYNQYNFFTDPEWESAAKRAWEFFAVAYALLGQAADLDETAAAELALIEAAQGVDVSPLLSVEGDPNPAMEDYSQYIVRGYYEGDPQLEAYFRTMMWYGRINWRQSVEELDRTALLITLALANDEDARRLWEGIYLATSFFAGASDDNGLYEYLPILEASFGEGTTPADVEGADEAWETFHELTAQAEAPAINSVPMMDDGVAGTDAASQNKGFRLMGQRWSLDATIFQQLIYDEVLEDGWGNRRMLPDALDVPAALGSDEALAILDAQGDTAFANYPEQMDKTRASIAVAGEQCWSGSLYSLWLRTLTPLLDQCGEGYPAFMRSQAWARKDLQTFCGSYAELKHDTVLYSKQVIAEMGGGDFFERDDRGYVEPRPQVFARLQAMVDAMAAGLSNHGLLAEEDAGDLAILSQLSGSLATIAAKELRDEPLADDEYELIRSYGGQLEHFWERTNRDAAGEGYFDSSEFPAAVVTDIATDPNGSVLEIGTGNCSKIYVVVPMDGSLRLATGSVYSFYQFPWPLNDRLTDSAWRQMQGFELADDGTYHRGEGVGIVDWAWQFTVDPYAMG